MLLLFWDNKRQLFVTTLPLTQLQSVETMSLPQTTEKATLWAITWPAGKKGNKYTTNIKLISGWKHQFRSDGASLRTAHSQEFKTDTGNAHAARAIRNLLFYKSDLSCCLTSWDLASLRLMWEKAQMCTKCTNSALAFWKSKTTVEHVFITVYLETGIRRCSPGHFSNWDPVQPSWRSTKRHTGT